MKAYWLRKLQQDFNASKRIATCFKFPTLFWSRDPSSSSIVHNISAYEHLGDKEIEHKNDEKAQQTQNIYKITLKRTVNIFFKQEFDIKNTSCNMFVRHLRKTVMKY